MSLSNDLKFLLRRVMQRTGLSVEESDSIYNELNNAVTSEELPDELASNNVITSDNIADALSENDVITSSNLADALSSNNVVLEDAVQTNMQSNTFSSEALTTTSTGPTDLEAKSVAHGLSSTPTVIFVVVDANPSAAGYSFTSITADDTDVTFSVALSTTDSDFSFRVIAF